MAKKDPGVKEESKRNHIKKLTTINHEEMEKEVQKLLSEYNHEVVNPMEKEYYENDKYHVHSKFLFQWNIILNQNKKEIEDHFRSDHNLFHLHLHRNKVVYPTKRVPDDDGMQISELFYLHHARSILNNSKEIMKRPLCAHQSIFLSNYDHYNNDHIK